MVTTMQPELQIPLESQQESEYIWQQERRYAPQQEHEDAPARPASKWNPALVKGLIVGVIVGYLVLAGLLIAVAASAGTGG